MIESRRLGRVAFEEPHSHFRARGPPRLALLYARASVWGGAALGFGLAYLLWREDEYLAGAFLLGASFGLFHVVYVLGQFSARRFKLFENGIGLSHRVSGNVTRTPREAIEFSEILNVTLHQGGRSGREIRVFCTDQEHYYLPESIVGIESFNRALVALQPWLKDGVDSRRQE